MNNLLGLAKSIAFTAHANQFRRDGITPYFDHVERVAGRLAGTGGWPARAVAYLHDIQEDNVSFPLPELPATVLAALDAMTKRPGESYSDYIERVKANPIARKVKVADILDNLSDTPTNHQIHKYAQALLVLVD